MITLTEATRYLELQQQYNDRIIPQLNTEEYHRLSLKVALLGWTGSAVSNFARKGKENETTTLAAQRPQAPQGALRNAHQRQEHQGPARALGRPGPAQEEKGETMTCELSPRAAKARFEGQGRARWRKYEAERQTREMAAGPRLLADGHTLIVPSEWYNEEAAAFWKEYGFQWLGGLSRWQRDTRKPASGKVYTAEAWLTATRRKFYEFWPTLLKECTICGQVFAPESTYQIYCEKCREEQNDD